ncbi:MAG: hypothetical protein CSA22_00270 [Deltaproteobacteria bacterium]|nr:MAG: hypothetical protein CSA22_00270 [Deltaproteobacteria bacterium]
MQRYVKKIDIRMIRMLTLLAVMTAAGCATQQPVTPVDTAETRQRLFEKAEKAFAGGADQKALSYYHEYTETYPRDSHAAEAYLKIGAILEDRNRPADARIAYQTILDLYPGSDRVLQARMKILGTYLHEENYPAVLQLGPELLASVAAPGDQARIHMALGEAAYGSGDLAAAVMHWEAVLGLTLPEAAFELENRMVAATELMTEPVLNLLMAQVTHPFVKGLLLFREGELHFSKEELEAAEDVFNRFIDTYPDHLLTGEVRDRLLALATRGAFEPYTIGCLLPLSGPFKAVGRRALQGVETAVRLLAQTGADAPIRFLFQDTQGKDELATDGVHALKAGGAAVIIGSMITADAASVAAQAEGIPMVVFSQKPDITLEKPFVFRNFIKPADQARALVRYTMEDLGMRRYAILYPEETYGRQFMNLFWDAVIAHGGVVTGVASYPVGQTDFSDAVKDISGLLYEVPADLMPEPPEDAQLDEAGEGLDSLETGSDMDAEAEGPGEPEPVIDFDAVFIPDAPSVAGMLIPQLRYYDIEGVRMLGPNLWHSPAFVRVGGQYVNHALFTDGFSASVSDARVKAFTRLYTATYDTAPGYIEAVAFDTAMILSTILSRPDIRYRTSILRALRQPQGFEGVTGHTVFDDTGEAVKPLQVMTLRRNRFIPVGGK